MARPPTRGTPSRSHGYLFPRPAHALVSLSAVLAAIVAGSLVAFDVGGRFYPPLRAPLMPGALVGQHSFARCETCHTPGHGASTFRCQRCHDESGPGRMTHAAHLGGTVRAWAIPRPGRRARPTWPARVATWSTGAPRRTS